MPRNSSGVYTLPEAPFTPGTTISSAAVNDDFSDIASALTGSVAADGSTTLTGVLKMLQGTVLLPSHTFATDLTTGMYYVSTKKLGFACGGVAAAFFDLNKAGSGQNGDIWYYGNGAIPSPVGRVCDFAGSTAPSGWLLCYGQNVSRTAYAELFNVISTTYGSGDGTTTFGLPDLRGRAVFGKDDMGGSAAGRLTSTTMTPDGITLGATGGAQTQSVLQANLPNISFTVSGITLNDPGHLHTYNGPSASQASGPGAVSAGSSALSTTSATTGITISSQGSAASGGSGTALITMPPAFIMNKIIFAGTP